MSERIKTALKGGGRISLTIREWADGSFHFEVTEDWARLTRVDRAELTAAEIAAAPDPDKLIHDTAIRLIGNYISYEARSMEGNDYEI